MLAPHDGSPALNGRCIEGPGNRRMGQYHRIITRATCGSTSLGLGFIIIFFFFLGFHKFTKLSQQIFPPSGFVNRVACKAESCGGVLSFRQLCVYVEL